MEASKILYSIVLTALVLLNTLPLVAQATPQFHPTQITEDKELTAAGGWTRDTPAWGYPEYFNETGSTRIYRYLGIQIIGSYGLWFDLGYGGIDAFLELYNYGYEAWTGSILVYFDNYSPYGVTFDLVTDITVAPYNATHDAIYWTAIGRDYSSLVTGIDTFHTGIYGYVTDGDFFVEDLGYYDINLSLARAMFGDDPNVFGIALTTLSYYNGYLYASGFYVYNDTTALTVNETLIVMVFNATNITAGPVAAYTYPLEYYAEYGESWRPVKSFIVDETLVLVGYHYYRSGDYELLDNIFVTTINATTLDHIGTALIPAYTGGYVVPTLKPAPYTIEYGYGLGYYDYMDAVIYDDILYIAGYGADSNGDYAAMVIAYNLTAGSVVWRDNIGNTSTTTYIPDFATGIDIVKDYKNNTHVVVEGTMYYDVSENISGYNIFYAVYNASTGELEYIYAVGGTGVDMGFDLAQIVYYSPEGPVIRPYYTAIASNSETLYLRNITSDYTAGTINPSSLTVKRIDKPVKAMELKTGLPTAGKSLATSIEERLGGKKLFGIDRISGGMWGSLLQPALPPATDLEVVYEPSETYIWEEDTKYVLINITAHFTENWTGDPLVGEEVWLYVAGPGIDWHRNQTGTTNATGYVEFQFNATQPGIYTFEVIFPGTVYHYRAFETFTVTLAKYKVIVDIYVNTTYTYTYFETPINITTKLTLINETDGIQYQPLADQEVIIDIYFDEFLSYLFFGDTAHTGWLWDQGLVFTSLVGVTDENGVCTWILEDENNALSTLMYWYAHNYTIRIVYQGNSTLATPQNFSGNVTIEADYTPTRVTLLDVPSTAYTGETYNITLKLEWSHDGFTTTHPLGNVTVYLMYNATLAGGSVYYYVGTTNASGMVTYPVSFLDVGTVKVMGMYLGNLTFDASNSTEYSITVEKTPVRLTVIQEPATTMNTTDKTEIVVKVERTFDNAPITNAAIFVYFNETYVGFIYTDSTGTASLEISPDVFGYIPPAGPFNLTLYFNGSSVQIVGGTPVFSHGVYNVTAGNVTTRIINMVKAPSEIVVFTSIPDELNYTQTYTFYVGVLVYNSTGPYAWLYNTTVSLVVNGTTVATGRTIYYAGGPYVAILSYSIPSATHPDPGTYEFTFSYGGAAGVQASTETYVVEVKWKTRIDVLPDQFSAEKINDTHARVTIVAKLERWNATAGAWEPYPGVTVEFYYVGSLVLLGTNTTDSSGIARYTGIVERGAPTGGFAAGVPETGDNYESTDYLPPAEISGEDKLDLDIVPTPELPLLPAILLLAVVLGLLLRRRK